MIFFDTETCGLHGPIVLFQYAEDNDDVELYSPWFQPINETLELLDWVTYNTVIGFNLAFDWFHVCQMYTTLVELKKLVGGNAIPINNITEYALSEPQARYGLCLKPEGAFDLMLHARKGPYQSTMDRKDIRIKRVPTQLAYPLAEELSKRLDIPDIYFGRRKDASVRWQVMDIINDMDVVDPNFKNLVLKFSPTSALKALVKDAGIGKPDRLLFSDIEISKKMRPKEYGYAPFALAVGNPDKWNWSWPDVIEHHIGHWAFNDLAREYAEDDVIDTRNLYHHFGDPEIDDDDSVLACMVGAVRWHGFAIDVDRINELRSEAVRFRNQSQYNFGSVAIVKRYLRQVMDDTESLVIADTTGAVVLKEISKWKVSDVCEDCMGDGCEKCKDGLIDTEDPHPAGARALEVLRWRQIGKEIELFDKLLRAGRFHASFKVIGTLSSRMAGADGLNAQGIKRANQIRSAFLLKDAGFQTVGGDFAGFEVCLADAVYADPLLREDLQSGKKIHALFGASVFPQTYEEVLATKGAPNPEEDLYTRAKSGLFALIYMGEAYTLANRVGIDIDAAEIGYANFIDRYKVFGQGRKKYLDMFCSMKQPKGIGTRVEWHEPSDYVESMFGFRRYFTMENRICRTLFELANDPPKEWQKYRVRVQRRDRDQTQMGATQSALYAAAFAVQGATARAAGNHVIQATGAQMTKGLQRRMWDIQPTGINHWFIIPFNVHDEVIAPSRPHVVEQVTKIKDDFVKEYLKHVPLLEMVWREDIESWAEK